MTQWNELLQKKLLQIDDKRGIEIFQKYHEAFSICYQEQCSVAIAVSDIQQMEMLSKDNPIKMILYPKENQLHLRLFQYNEPIPLADILPLLENVDLRAQYENPYQIRTSELIFWINDLAVTYLNAEQLDLAKVKDLLQDLFIHTLKGLSENDGFNKLVLGAQLSWREITILRSYTKYLLQIGFRFSQAYIAQALVNNASIAKDLVNFFLVKFDPVKTNNSKINEIESRIKQSLESVASLDEDRIIRRMLHLINATLRTNYFQKKEDGHAKDYHSFKLRSHDIPGLPLPLPLYEIFVYSPRFEGIHLRNSKVARGGIRWSDRREDFRSEILGLMKAQIVKNSVIVPSGAKGGFVLKTMSLQATRDAIQAEVVTCYQLFISGLLDLTDNLKNKEIIKPSQTVCYDDNDPYLVVAADKGTASFSDIANDISKKYHFWLGDAFASGGSTGYDHKKMGITARGAWESIKRHFYDLNVNIHENDFTVVGIGDMSGDVFGNGMIYSSHIQLIGAFDHRHIFLDPNPDSENTYQERLRLFNLSTSSWEDFNPSLISKGGGVYKRSSKSIPLSTEMQKVLDVNEDKMTPHALIRALLKAPVDLLWNGGIGTYVKAKNETNETVGDKENEYCRVNGEELRCRVVGEGGNLGFTQLGRVEYAQQGGLINTDFIDNSAGVDCSDHEVNIKIFLNQFMNQKNIDEQKRNQILIDMTDAVANLVLKHNYEQALAMSIVNLYSKRFMSMYQLYMNDLEKKGILNREVEFLPDEKKLLERKSTGNGLTRPELAILMAYTKIHLKNEILHSDIPDYHYLNPIFYSAFPKSLQKTYDKELNKHSLRREIIATQLSHQIINETGIGFIYNLQNETSAPTPDILRAYIVASHVFETTELQHLIQSLDYKITSSLQYELFGHIKRLIYLSSRWFLRYKNLTYENMENVIHNFRNSIKSLEKSITPFLSISVKNYLDSLSIDMSTIGISPEIVHRIVTAAALYSGLNWIEITEKYHFDLVKTMEMFYAVGDYFSFGTFRDQITHDTPEEYWENISHLKLRDQIDILQSRITVSILKNQYSSEKPQKIIEEWAASHERPMLHWKKIIEILHSPHVDYVMLFIALHELSDLINQ